ncbi:MAG: hypothetical protein AAB438_03170, partial [Patescibacteria group bacterium]
NNAHSLVMRYLKADGETIATFIGSLPKEVLGGDTVGGNQITGSFLPENITDISVSPNTQNLFYLFNVRNGVAGIVSSTLGENKVQVFDSAFTEWLSGWPNEKMITLTTKPSALVPGYMYVVDPEKKDFTKLISNINGLTTLTSFDGKYVLYSNNLLSLNILDLEGNDTIRLRVRTLPEKCVWAKNSYSLYCAVPKSIAQSSYPDSWYQGEISFTDDIWKIDTITGNGTKILIPETFEEALSGIDGIKLAIDDGENYLFFVNKKDNMLWELELK